MWGALGNTQLHIFPPLTSAFREADDWAALWSRIGSVAGAAGDWHLA